MRPPHLSSIVIGCFGEELLRDGWHEREHDGRSGIPYRACGGIGTLALRRVPGARGLHLLVSGPSGLSYNPLRGMVRICGAEHRMLLTVDAWVWRSFPLPPQGTDSLEIELCASEAIVPHHHLRNGDARSLGWFLSAVWQE